MTILFLHGWTSISGGVKPTYLKDHGHIVINPTLPDEDFTKAVGGGSGLESIKSVIRIEQKKEKEP